MNPINNSIFNTLLLNVYLPTDYGTLDSCNSFSESLAELEGFISSHSYDNLSISGDFNVNFSRGGPNCNSHTSFMRVFNLVRADVNPNIKYTYRHDDHTSFSWPDHVLTLSQHVNLINDTACFESVDNFSDHLPLSFNVSIAPPLTLSSALTTKPNSDSYRINSCKVD